VTSPNISFTLTASDKTTEAFNSVNKGLDGLQKNTDRFTQAGGVAGALGGNASNQLRNASYQITDFIVQVQGGQRVSLALSQQLPQLLAGFGAMGAALGLVAAVFPSIVAAFGSSVDEGKKLEESLGDINSAIGEVGKTARDFRMDDLYKEFNAANAVTREGIIEQVKFQQAMIETQRLLAEQSLSKSLQGIGDFGFLDKLKGAFADSGADKLAKDLGVSTTLAEEMLPAIKAVRDHTDDAANFMQRFGLALAQSSGPGAQKLLKQMQDMAKAEQDAYAAQGKLSEAQQKMQKAGAAGQIAIPGKDKKAGAGKVEADPTAIAYGKAMEQLAKLTDDANVSQIDLSKSQRALLDLMSQPQWADMPETWKQTALAQFQTAQAAEEAANSTKRLNDLVAAGDTSKLEKMRDDMLLLTKALEDGVISEEKYLDAVSARAGLGNKALEKQKGLAEELGLTFTSAFEDAVVSGKGFSSVLKGLEQDIIRVLARLTITKPLTSAFDSINWGGLASSFFGSSSSGTTGLGSLPASVNRTFADGGVFESSPSLSEFSGTVVSKPTTFWAAGGNVMGEAGPEGIFPLKRGLDGKLGVSAQGVSGANVTVNVINNAGAETRTEKRSDGKGGSIIDVFIDQVRGAIASDISLGSGPVPAAMQSSYGLNRAAGAY
jgi:hypothetical protein